MNHLGILLKWRFLLNRTEKSLGFHNSNKLPDDANVVVVAKSRVTLMYTGFSAFSLGVLLHPSVMF